MGIFLTYQFTFYTFLPYQTTNAMSMQWRLKASLIITAREHIGKIVIGKKPFLGELVKFLIIQ